MNSRDKEWLTEHVSDKRMIDCRSKLVLLLFTSHCFAFFHQNTRRKKYHQQYGKKYVPLKWSEGLKDAAAKYAEELLSSCPRRVS